MRYIAFQLHGAMPYKKMALFLVLGFCLLCVLNCTIVNAAFKLIILQRFTTSFFKCPKQSIKQFYWVVKWHI